MPASLEEVAQQLPAPSAETLAELAAVQDIKREAFEAGAVGWIAWNGDYTVGSVSTTSAISWTNWNVAYATTGGHLTYEVPPGTVISSGESFTIAANSLTITGCTAEQVPETEEQRAERVELARQDRERWAREAEQQRREQEAARVRSLALLRSLLSDGQWASYQEKGWFEVTGSSGRRWRVRDDGQSGNVDLMAEDGDVRDATYCAHPPGYLPDPDAHAAQMLALVTDDEAFLAAANCHWRRRPGGEVPPFMRVAA